MLDGKVISIVLVAEGTGFDNCYLPFSVLLERCYDKEKFDTDRSVTFTL